ncbi:MAG: ATP-binding protein [Pseudomonadota bacterium]
MNRSIEKSWGLHFGNSFSGKYGAFNKLEIYTLSEDNSADNVLALKRKYKSIDGVHHLNLERLKQSRIYIYFEKSAGVPVTIPLRIIDTSTKNTISEYTKIFIFAFLLVGLAFFFSSISLLTSQYKYLSFSAYYLSLILILLLENEIIIGGIASFTGIVIFPYFLVSISALFIAKVFWINNERPFLKEISFTLIASIALGTFLSGIIVFQFIPSLATFLIYTPILLFILIIPFVSLFLSQDSREEGTPFMFGWFIFLFGIIISSLPLLKIIPLIPAAMNAYWYAIIPQAFFFIIATRILLYDNDQKPEMNVVKISETDSVQKFRQSRESNEQERLLRVIEQERRVLKELRNSEAKKTEEMRIAKEDADSANKAKSAFLAVVTHEIRTPMTGIMGMVKLLLDSNLSKEQNNYANTIQESGDSMLTLLNDILDFEKIQQGKMSFENISFDLRRMINGVYTLMNGHAIQKNIKLEIKIGDNVPQYVFGDPTRLRQVLLNFTGNAVKFTNEGQVTISVERIDSKSKKGTVEIYFAVSDTGIGIAPEAQKNLFNPFSQADSTISRKFGGTGLGLAISKGLVEAMGSEIQLTSKEGEGSTFFFTINMALSGADEVIAASEQPNNQSKSKKILMVDDNEVNQKVVVGFLKDTDHEVETTYTAESAIQRLKEEKFDLVFMDIELDGMNGDEATRKIRSEPHENFEDLTIIALTGNLMPDQIEEFKKSGMNHVLEKPIDPEKLKDAINLNFETQTFETQTEVVETKEEKSEIDKNVLDDKILNELSLHVSLDEVKAMLDDVVKKSREIIGSIEKGLETNDFDIIRARCHDLKGMTGNFGLVELSASANELEEQAKNLNIKDDRSAIINSFQEKEKRAIKALQTWASNM